jgi:hypothetical protein
VVGTYRADCWKENGKKFKALETTGKEGWREIYEKIYDLLDTKKIIRTANWMENVRNKDIWRSKLNPEL